MSNHIQSLEPRKLFAAGALDQTFGSGGVARYSFDPTTFHFAGAGLQPGGRLVIAAMKGTGPGTLETEPLLLRFRANGTLDTGFAGATTVRARPRGLAYI